MLADSSNPASTDESGGKVDVESGGSLQKQGSSFAVSFRRGLHVGFQDIKLELSATKKKPAKGILNGITGSVKPGRLTAILGPTGSGKSSLLNVLAARTRHMKGLVMTGTMTVGGIAVEDWTKYRRESAYVEQDDLMFSNLTVLETITLASELRLPREMTSEERRERVRAVLQELGLKRVVDTIIGNAKVRGVSGGERKRVSIACEILIQPGVFFLDEPTSGLDAFQALRVVSTIKDLAQQGRTIVASIHQPRSAIFALFDDVLVLSEGRIMYSGRAGELSSYLESVGHPLPKDFNPADFALDLMSLDLRSDDLERETRLRLEHFSTSYAERSVRKIVSGGDEGQIKMDQIKTTRKFEATRAKQFWLLTQRALRQKRRDKRQVAVPFFVSCFFGFLLGFIYYGTGRNLSQNAIQDKVWLLFFIVVNQSFMGFIGTVSTFPAERDIVTRERSANSYAVLPYFASKILADLPSLIFPFVLTTICFWLAALSPSGSAYIILCVVSMLTYECSASLGLLLSAATNSPEAAMGLGQPVQLVFMLFSGFYANTNLIPAALAWIQWLSPVRYAFGAAIVNEFTGLVFTCTGASTTGCVPNGQAEIERLGMTEDSVGRNLGILLGFCLVYFSMGYFVMRWKKVRWLVPTPAHAKPN